MYQLADSALPTGGFVFSSGLESAYTIGWLKNAKDLLNYLIGAVHSFAHSELVFLGRFYDSALHRSLNWQSEVDWYQASLSSQGARKASSLQGKSWLHLVETLFAKEIQKSELPWNKTEHFLPQLAQTLVLLKKEKEDCLAFAYFLFCRDQVSAGVRLGICGPMDGQKILQHLLKLQERMLNSIWDEKTPKKTAVGWELSQALHSRVYSTLFQN